MAETATRPTVPSSGSHQPSRTTADGFALGGPSALPDPRTHAYRKDLADVALAGTVVASHYAEPVERRISAVSALLDQPTEGATTVATLEAGEPFAMLDDSLGWAWGYGGKDRLTGYVRSDALTR